MGQFARGDARASQAAWGEGPWSRVAEELVADLADARVVDAARVVAIDRATALVVDLSR
jgi:hypothetical protein